MNTTSVHIVHGPALQAEIPAITLPEYIRRKAREVAGEVALVDAASGRSYTYGQLDHLIGRFAAGLTRQGFRPGDTLLMFAPNLPEWVIAALGTMVAGGVISGANPTYTVDELAHQMRDSGATFVFTIPSFLATVRDATLKAGIENIVLLGEDEGTLSFAALVACTDPQPTLTIDPEALAMLPYSSGTTGPSKGVRLSHRAMVTHTIQLLQATNPGIKTILALLPMFHASGFTVITLLGLALGAKLVTLPRFEPEGFLQAIAHHQVDFVAVVPPIMLFLAAHPMVSAHDLSCVKLIASGAAPLSEAVERKVVERLAVPVAQAYGMTEACCILTYSPANTKAGSSGQLFPATQARVVCTETGVDLPRGQTGELWFRGPHFFSGYHRRPDSTAVTLVDGWLRTGDIGHVDEDGFVFITDRLKELIKVKGFQVPPAELEALLLTHPQVADAAVIGRPDERSGEVPVAFVVPRGELDAEGIKAWVAARVVEYKWLHDVLPCEAIPKNASGKILRRVLRDQQAQAMGPKDMMNSTQSFSISRLTSANVKEMRELLGVFAETFCDAKTYGSAVPTDDYLMRLLAKDTFIVLTAFHKGSVVGGLAAYQLEKFEQARSEIYIYDLAVTEPFRRIGLATSLIERLRRIGVTCGAHVIFVQADYGDDPAIALYTKLGTREDVMHFDIAIDAAT